MAGPACRLLASYFVHALKLRGNQMELGFTITERFERANRFEDVIAVVAGPAVALPHIVHAIGDIEPTGILHMAAVDDVAQRPHLTPRFVFKLDPPHSFEIDAGDLLATAQIGDGFVALRSGDTIGNTAAHAATVETQHQAGAFRRAAMNVR